MSTATTTAESFKPTLYWHKSAHPTFPFSGIAIHSRGGPPSKFHGVTIEELQRHAEWNNLALEGVESTAVLRAVETLARSCCELTLERARELAAAS